MNEPDWLERLAEADLTDTEAHSPVFAADVAVAVAWVRAAMGKIAENAEIFDDDSNALLRGEVPSDER